MLVWTMDTNAVQTFKVVRLSDGKVILDEELYEDFDKNYKCLRTNHGTHHFHCMDFDEYVAGVVFDKEEDARQFEKKIPIMGPKPIQWGITQSNVGVGWATHVWRPGRVGSVGVGYP